MKTELKVTLNASARNAIVASFCNALDTNESTGSLVTQVCDTAQRFLKGEDINEGDRANIVADIAKARGWKGPSLRSRSSEVNVVLRSYAKLPEAVKLFSTKAKAVHWHDSMKIARRLNAGDSIAQAVKAAFATKGQSVKSTPQGRAAGALKAWFKVAKADKKDLIIQAATLLGLKLGVKLDA